MNLTEITGSVPAYDEQVNKFKNLKVTLSEALQSLKKDEPIKKEIKLNMKKINEFLYEFKKFNLSEKNYLQSKICISENKHPSQDLTLTP